MTRQSTKFLKNPEDFLADMVKNLNYDTCHAIRDYDATKCAEDCKQLEREDFAKECTDNGGLFKCCIRYFGLPIEILIWHLIDPHFLIGDKMPNPLLTRISTFV